MEIVKDVQYARVNVHSHIMWRLEPTRYGDWPSEGLFGDFRCDSCPWGLMHQAILVVNGFPHKRILRFDPRRLHHDVMEWMGGAAI